MAVRSRTCDGVNAHEKGKSSPHMIRYSVPYIDDQNSALNNKIGFEEACEVLVARSNVFVFNFAMGYPKMKKKRAICSYIFPISRRICHNPHTNGIAR